MRKIILYSMLVLGSIIFSLPFAWLVLTTFKGADELTGGSLIPKLPYKVISSPYIGYMAYPEIEKPPKLSNERWKNLEAGLKNEIWNLTFDAMGREKFKNDYSYLFEDEAKLKKEIIKGIWQELIVKLPESTWKETDEVISASLEKSINAKIADRVFKQIFKSFTLKSAVLEDKDLNVIKAKPVDGWKTGEDSKIIESIQGAIVIYDFEKNKSPKEIYADFIMPSSDFKALGRFMLSFESDTSFHELFFEIKTSTGTYVTKNPVIMDAQKDTAVSLCLGEPGRLEPGDTIMHKINSSDAMPDGLIKVKVILEKNPYYAAIYSKFTKSYRDAMKPLSKNITIINFTYNSVFLAIVNIIGQLLSCSLIAYAFARIKWPGRDICFVILLSTMMLPAQVTMIPLFVIFSKIGWYDTLMPLWVPSFFGQAFFIFLLRQFFMTIPKELDDAAKIDGCGHFGIYWRILLPQMKPALATVVIFAFMSSWNNFIGPLIYLSSLDLYPLALGLSFFRDTQGSFWGLLMAASTLMILPIIIIFFFAQKYFIQGTTLTGMKG